MFNTCSNFCAEGSERFKASAYGPIEPRSPLTWKFSRNREFSPQSTPDRGRWLQTKHSDPIRKTTYAAHDGCYGYWLHSGTDSDIGYTQRLILTDIGYTQGLTLTLISVTLRDSYWLISVTLRDTPTLISLTLRDSHWLWYRLHSGTYTDSDIGYTQGLILT
jgi:hypothetical protein